MAVDSEKMQLVRTMLEFGANPNTKSHIYIDGPDDITPLHSACASKELLQLLLDHGADTSAKDSKGRTPADWVALDDSRDFDLVVTPDGPRIRPRIEASTKASR
jgi:ankyrin repeat protein